MNGNSLYDVHKVKWMGTSFKHTNYEFNTNNLFIFG